MGGLFIFSDLHGRGRTACAISAAISRRGGVDALERIVFCGDAYNPGRGLLVANLLGNLEASGKFTAVEGNCDYEPAEEGLKYTMIPDYATVDAGGHRLFVTHGDRWNPRRLPPAGLGDVLVYGHTHLPDAQRLPEPEGMVLFNPGSCGSPRGGWPPTYGWMENGTMSVCQLEDDKVLMSVALK